MLAALALLLSQPTAPLLFAAPAPVAPAARMARRPVRTRGITVAIPDAAPAIGLPPVEGSKDKDRPLIVIDPGHGGHDPGAVNADHGWREKDVTLGIARAVRKALLATGRYRVALTRDSDEFLILQERYGIARRLKADLFLSIHADAAANEEARGATIYTLSEIASDREAARLAARENRADILNGIDLSRQTSSVSSILIDLTQRDSMATASQFAETLLREGAPYLSFHRRPHRFASLVVLKSPDTPSVLLETGYISNEEDGEMLTSPAGQRRIARGVVRAVTVHFARLANR